MPGDKHKPLSDGEPLRIEGAEVRLRSIRAEIATGLAFCRVAELELDFGRADHAHSAIEKLRRLTWTVRRHLYEPNYAPSNEVEEVRTELVQLESRILAIEEREHRALTRMSVDAVDDSLTFDITRILEVVQHSPIAMVVTKGAEQQTVLMNDRFTKLFGYTRHDVAREAQWWPLAYPDAAVREKLKAEWRSRIENALRDGTEIEPMEAVVRCKDGSRRTIEFHFASLGDVSIVSFIDLTDRKRTEDALRESEELFRLVATTAPVMIWMSGADKLCTYFNSQWLAFTGRALVRELGNGWAEGVHPDDLPYCLETYENKFDRREPFQMDYRLRRHDGEYRWVHDVGVPRFQIDSTFAGYIGSCIDITERKAAEMALSSVSGRILEAQDEERAHVARELHDDINQRLGVVAIDLDYQAEAPADELRRRMAKATKEISELAGEIHAMSHRLHPSRLDSLGLVETAEAFCRELVKRHKIEIRFYSDGIPEKLPNATSICLFRVLQEALQNAVKHSGVKQFEVSLMGSTNEIFLTVWDEGQGFHSKDILYKNGIGLTSMKERLKLLGGELSLETKPRGGTIVHAKVPLP